VAESSHNTKIETLIKQLEEEVRRLSTAQQLELNQAREASAIEIKTLSEDFDSRLYAITLEYHSRISDLEGTIEYLKELNFAQRLMMEDSLGYVKELEEKLSTTRDPDPPEPEA